MSKNGFLFPETQVRDYWLAPKSIEIMRPTDPFGMDGGGSLDHFPTPKQMQTASGPRRPMEWKGMFRLLEVECWHSPACGAPWAVTGEKPSEWSVCFAITVKT